MILNNVSNLIEEAQRMERIKNNSNTFKESIKSPVSRNTLLNAAKSGGAVIKDSAVLGAQWARDSLRNKKLANLEVVDYKAGNRKFANEQDISNNRKSIDAHYKHYQDKWKKQLSDKAKQDLEATNAIIEKRKQRKELNATTDAMQKKQQEESSWGNRVKNFVTRKPNDPE